MKPAHNPATLDEKAQAKVTAQAEAILRKTDGLRVLKPSTVGYTIALSAVEAALREAAAGASTAQAAPATPLPDADDYAQGKRMVDFISQFDDRLVAANFTHAQRLDIVGALLDKSPSTAKLIGMRQITVAVMDGIADDTPDVVVAALSSACGRLRELLGARKLLPSESGMMTCPTCDGTQRISATEWCTRCDRSGIIPASATALAEMVENGLKPYAWENGITGEMSKDDEIGFIWELNRDDVTRLYAIPLPDAASKA